MSKAGRISDDFVKKLTPPDHGQRIYWDDKIDGFGVRVNAGGSITFVLNYTMNKTRRRYGIGRYPDWNATTAREQAKALSVDIDKGIDPMQKREPSTEKTFADLAEHYLMVAETHKRPGSLRNDRGNIKRLLVQWSDRTVASFTKGDMEKLQRDLKETPVHANRNLSLLSRMFNKAVEEGWRTDNPVKGIKKFREEGRERWLSVDEIARLKRACDNYHDQTAANAIRLLMLTGAREGEVLKADWKQFDLKRGVWTKPSHHTKSQKIDHTPLSPEAIALLKRMKPKDAGMLFPGRVGFNDGARVTLRRPWIQLCKAARLSESVERKGKKRTITRYRPTVHIHDLRHTFASHLVSNKVPLSIVQKLLAHTQARTTERYSHLANEPLQQATNVFGGIFAAAGKQ